MKNARSYNAYGDNLARKKRRRFFVKLLLLFLATVGVGVSLFYIIFFSQLMQIKDVTITGLKTLKPNGISSIINSEMETDFFSQLHIKLQKNIFFFDEAQAKSEILAQFPIIKDLEINKNYLHKLVLAITERTAIGTWCFGDDGSTSLTTSCKYFDDDGFMWSNAIRSSGSLLLTIEDLRVIPEKTNRADTVLVDIIKNIVSGLNTIGIKINKLEIPNATGDLKVYTNRDYYILFNAGPDTDKQINALKIFLNEQNKDFHPEYIDARIAGRIYYK